jgi:hypothetical protein
VTQSTNHRQDNSNQALVHQLHHQEEHPCSVWTRGCWWSSPHQLLFSRYGCRLSHQESTCQCLSWSQWHSALLCLSTSQGLPVNLICCTLLFFIHPCIIRLLV